MTYLNVLARGARIWLVPLLVSFGFYTPSGELTTAYAPHNAPTPLAEAPRSHAARRVGACRGKRPLRVE